MARLQFPEKFAETPFKVNLIAPPVIQCAGIAELVNLESVKRQVAVNFVVAVGEIVLPVAKSYIHERDAALPVGGELVIYFFAVIAVAEKVP